MVKEVKTKNYRFILPVGFAFWIDYYNYKTHGMNGRSNNLVIPFMKFSWGRLLIPQQSRAERRKRQ